MSRVEDHIKWVIEERDRLGLPPKSEAELEELRACMSWAEDAMKCISDHITEEVRKDLEAGLWQVV